MPKQKQTNGDYIRSMSDGGTVDTPEWQHDL